MATLQEHTAVSEKSSKDQEFDQSPNTKQSELPASLQPARSRLTWGVQQLEKSGQR